MFQTRNTTGKNSTWVSKNAEFDADFEFVEKLAKNITQKSYGPKTFAHINKSKKTYF
jgi:hypothetical protein